MLAVTLAKTDLTRLRKWLLVELTMGNNTSKDIIFHACMHVPHA
jgi:hypothetical protein